MYILYIILAIIFSVSIQAMSCINGGDSQANFQYSGVLTDETGVTASGFQTVQMRFDLFSAMDSIRGDYTQVFESVEVKDGIFTIEVGPCLPDLTKSYYVQLAVNNEDLSTRTKLVTLPVSINALNSQKISGLTTQELFLKIDESISLVLVDFSESTIGPALDIMGQSVSDHASNVNNPHSVTKDQVGLSLVDNVKQLPMTMFQTVLGVNDTSKVPSSNAVAEYIESQLSTITVTGFELENPDLVAHLTDLSNPHNVSKSQLQLDQVTNVLQLPMSYLQTVLSTTSDINVPSSSAVATYVNYRLDNQQTHPADQLTASEITSIKSNTLSNGSSPWTSKENVITSGDNTQYFRGDKTFQTLDKTAVGLNLVPNTNIAYATAIAADQFNATEVTNVKASTLADGTTPWTGKEDSVTAGTTAQYYRGDKTFQALTKSTVGLSLVPNTNIAYSATIAADQFTATDVTNVKANTLADGSTPWIGKENALPVGDSTNYLRGDRAFVTIAADQFNATEVSNVKANGLANGTTPWIGKENALPAGDSTNYLRGDRTFVTIPADQLTTTEVDNLQMNYLSDGTSPWNNSEGALGAATSGQVLAGDRTWRQLNPALVGLGKVEDLNVKESFAQNAGQFIETSKIKANSNSGLSLHSQSGQGMFISSNGHIGINTTSPMANLHIAGSADVTTLFVDDLNSEQAYFESTSFPPLVVNTHPGDSGVALFVTPSGNVGINTTAPMATLDIDGVLNVNGDILQYGVLFDGGSSDGATHLETSGALDTFVTTGNFGIGIPNPLEKLEVNGGVRIGYSGGSNPGTIRFNAGSFEGFDGASWVSLDDTGATSGSGGGNDDYALIVDSKPGGTNGGSAQADTWTTRIIQTTIHNDNNIVSLVSNQFTLGSGTYLINANAPAYQVNGHKIQLYNVTANQIEITGNSLFTPSGDGVVTYAFLSTKLTLAVSTTFEIRHYTSATKANNGLGINVVDSGGSDSNIFTSVEITKKNSSSGGGSGATNLVDSGSDTNLTNGFLGLNISNPSEILDVAGKVRMRTTSDNTGFDGTIRWSGSDLEVKKAGTWKSLTSGGLSTGSSTGDDYILLADVKGSGANGGNSIAGWVTRDLQTVLSDESNIVTLAGNEFTLPAGDYRLYASAPAYRANGHKIELYNSTDAYSIATGTTEYNAEPGYAQTASTISTKFTITTSKSFSIRHHTATAISNNGLGFAASQGSNIYTRVEIFKEYGGSSGESGATNLVDSGSDTNLTNGFLGLNIPNPSELLDINGKMRMRTTSDNNGLDGTIRWSGNDLEVKKAGVWHSLTSGGSSNGSTSSGDDYALIVDRKDGNTTGGAAPSASWTTRTLQTIIQNENNIVQLSNDNFTLQPGTYHMDIDAPASIVARHQIVLVDSNNEEVLVTGTAAVASSAGVQSRSLISTKMTLAATRTFEVRHYIQSSTGTSDLGVATQLDHSIYTRVQIWKLGGGSDNGPNDLLSDSDNDTSIDVEQTPDSDRISFKTSGVERMKIQSDGKIGLGIANPVTKLHIDGGITLGHTGATEDGTIRFNEVVFEGYDGSDWVRLDVQPRGSLNQNNESGSSATISGGASNTASGTLSVVSGGNSNIASASYSTVSGGNSNLAASSYATVAGGTSNQANGSAAFIGAGGSNQANGGYSVVTGGNGNQAIGAYSVVSGGNGNAANGLYSVIPGGSNMTMNGTNSFGFNGSGTAKTSNAANSAIFMVDGFGINTVTPAKDFHVVGNQLIEGSLCIGDPGSCSNLNGFGNLYSQGTFGSGGADYAEYFASNETLVAGDIVGFDKLTGKVRKYQNGDKLVGIISTKPGMIGAGDRDPKTHALVGLLGQLPFDGDQVVIEDSSVFTKDGQKIGLLLADGNVYINLNPADETSTLKKQLLNVQKQLDDLTKKLNFLMQNHKK